MNQYNEISRLGRGNALDVVVGTSNVRCRFVCWNTLFPEGGAV